MKKLTLLFTIAISTMLLASNSYAKNNSKTKTTEKEEYKIKKKFSKGDCFCYKKESMELLLKASQKNDRRAMEWFFNKRLCSCFGNEPEFSYLGDEIKGSDASYKIVPVVVYDGTPQVLYFFLKDVMEGMYF